MVLESCIICGAATDSRCSRCKAAHYCSKKCQRKDRPLHKLLCDSYIPFLESRPAHEPGEIDNEADLGCRYIVAIIFPVAEPKPKLIWLKCQGWAKTDEEPAWQTLCSGVKEYEDCMGETGDGGRFGREIQIWVGSGCWGQPPNMCVSTLNAGYESVDRSIASVIPSVACGSTVIVSINRCKEQCSADQKFNDDLLEDEDLGDPILEFGGPEADTYNDTTLADLRHGFDFYSKNNNIFESAKSNPYFIRRNRAWCKAVIISCSGDMHYLGKKKYREVELDRLHPIFYKSQANRSPVSHLMDIPLVVKKLNFSPSWIHETSRGTSFAACDNFEASRLMVMADTEGDSWNCPVPGWDTGIDPPVLVALSNFKDIVPNQVEGLVKFFARWQWHISDEYVGDTRWRKKVLERYFQSDKFERHMEKLKLKKLKAGEADWADVAPLRGDRTGKSASTSTDGTAVMDLDDEWEETVSVENISDESDSDASASDDDEG